VRSSVDTKVWCLMLRRSLTPARLAPLALAVFAACGSSGSTPPTTTTPAGLANPASVYCVKQGGRVEIVDQAGGQVGYCNLPDGTRVDEWEYYRSQTGATSQP
jgi:putative hemolysin